MRTRTLLLLAIVCGLAILIAGGIQLLRVGDDGSIADDLRIGDRATAGDLVVTVLDANEIDGRMRVDVTLGGVDAPDVLDDFTLLGSGSRLSPLSAVQAGAGGCNVATVAEQSCTLVFGTAEVEGSTRVLLLQRGEDRHRWTLVQT